MFRACGGEVYFFTFGGEGEGRTAAELEKSLCCCTLRVKCEVICVLGVAVDGTVAVAACSVVGFAWWWYFRFERGLWFLWLGLVCFGCLACYCMVVKGCGGWVLVVGGCGSRSFGAVGGFV